jgi:hypothetical protein
MSYSTYRNCSRTSWERTRATRQWACLSHSFEVFAYPLGANEGHETVSISYGTHLRCSRTIWEWIKATRRSASPIAHTWGVHVLSESGWRPRAGQHVLSHLLEVFTYWLRADQGHETVSISYRTHLGSSRTNWERIKVVRQSASPIADTRGVHAQTENRLRPRDGQHILSHTLEVFTYCLRVDQGYETVSMSYRTHLRFSRTNWERIKATRRSASPMAHTWGFHVLSESGSRPWDGQHLLSHTLEVFTYPLEANEGHETVSISYSTHLRFSRTAWERIKAARRSAYPIAHTWGFHIPSGSERGSRDGQHLL